METKNVLNKRFTNVSEWFADNSQSIHFGASKSTCILFSKENNLLEVVYVLRDRRENLFLVVH